MSSGATAKNGTLLYNGRTAEECREAFLCLCRRMYSKFPKEMEYRGRLFTIVELMDAMHGIPDSRADVLPSVPPGNSPVYSENQIRRRAEAFRHLCTTYTQSQCPAEFEYEDEHYDTFDLVKSMVQHGHNFWFDDDDDDDYEYEYSAAARDILRTLKWTLSRRG